MNPHKLSITLLVSLCLLPVVELAAQRTPPSGGRVAVVVDERLAALRATPQLNSKLVRRLGRGRQVAVRSAKTTPDGITFLLVNISSRTHGWIQREAVVTPSRVGDDKRLFSLIESSSDFDRIVRSRIFLNYFRVSSLRVRVLLMLGDAAEAVSEKLTRDASKRIRPSEVAPESSYFLNFSGLDRYNRQGVGFVFEPSTKRLHYDGASWREIVRRFPKSPQANEASERLRKLSNRCPTCFSSS
jgi:hypothetical protein